MQLWTNKMLNVVKNIHKLMFYLFSFTHLSLGTPIVKFLYGIPLMASTGFPSLFNNLTLPVKSLDERGR